MSALHATPFLPGIDRPVAEALPRLPVRPVQVAPILSGHSRRVLLREQLPAGRYLLAIGKRVLGEVLICDALAEPIEVEDTTRKDHPQQRQRGGLFWSHAVVEAKSYDEEVWLR